MESRERTYYQRSHLITDSRNMLIQSIFCMSESIPETHFIALTDVTLVLHLCILITRKKS